VEAEEAQCPQPVLGDPPIGGADEAHPSRCDIGKAADRIIYPTIQIDGQGVDGEIPPFGIRLPVAAEAHDGTAAIRLDILAQRRHLDDVAMADHRHRAVLNAGRRDLEASGLGPRHHRFRNGRRRDVDIGDRQPHQRIPHGAADNPRRLALGRKERQDLPDQRIGKKRRVPAIPDGQSKPPGTSTPSRNSAG
jgi:hypothetical protein